VSTDDPEIASISKTFGAEVIWRPLEISGDSASSESALLHVLKTIEGNGVNQPFLTVFLQCTSPLTIVDDIDGTIQKLLDENADSCFTATEFHYFLWGNDNFGNANGLNHDKLYRPRRQDRLAQFVETGAVYVMKTELFLKYKHRFFGRTVMYHTPRERYFEIDEPIDLEIVESILIKAENANMLKNLPEKIEAIFFDFDGVFTNNKVILNENGQESIVADRGDGLGISLLKKMGIDLYILSTEKNDVVHQRAKKISVKAFNKLDNKLIKLKEIIKEKNYNKDNCIFVGNDINDYDCLKYIGCGVVVNDAYLQVKKIARIVLKNNGGEGAVRELIELINERYNNERN